MRIMALTGREHEASVIELLGAAQVHRSPLDARARAPSIADEYANSGRLRLWGYLIRNDVVGIVGVEPRSSEATVIRDLSVASAQRGRGVGRALIEFLRNEGGFDALEGDTLVAARPFYERCGFNVTEDGTMPDGATRYRFVWRRA